MLMIAAGYEDGNDPVPPTFHRRAAVVEFLEPPELVGTTRGGEASRRALLQCVDMTAQCGRRGDAEGVIDSVGAAASWDRVERIIARIEAGPDGVDTRFIATLGLDADRQEIVAAKLTAADVGDVSVLAELLDQIDADVASLPAEGVYDGEGAYNAVVERHPAASVVIMPRATAVPSETTTTQRDRHHAAIGEHGRIAWQRSLGYSRRCLVETAMCRYTTIIGRRLRARCLRTQRTEAKAAWNVLNRMTWLGMPVAVQIV